MKPTSCTRIGSAEAEPTRKTHAWPVGGQAYNIVSAVAETYVGSAPAEPYIVSAVAETYDDQASLPCLVVAHSGRQVVLGVKS